MEISWFIENETITVAENIGREPAIQAETTVLDEKEYAACGGGFPIRVEEVGVIGTIAITGLDHVSEHDLLVKCISKYLHVAEVPRIRAM